MAEEEKRLCFSDLAEDFFDEVCKYEEDALSATRALVRHMKRLAKADADHAHALAAISRASGRELQASSPASWMVALCGCAASRGAAHGAASAAAADDVCRPLARIVAELRTELRALSAEGARCGAADVSARKSLLDAVRAVDRRRAEAAAAYARRFLALRAELPERERAGAALVADAIGAWSHADDEAAACERIRASASSSAAAARFEAAADDGNKSQRRRSRIFLPLARKLGFSMSSVSPSSAAMLEHSPSLPLTASVPPLSPQPPSMLRHQQQQQQQQHLSQSSLPLASSSSSSQQQTQQTQQQQGVLGVTLEALMQRQKEAYPSLSVPLVLVLLRDTLTHRDALKVEGIFRIPGSQQHLSMYREMLSRQLCYGRPGGTERYFRLIRGTTTPTVAALFKLFLRELPTPVVPSDLYEAFTRREFVESLTAANFGELVLDRIGTTVHRRVFCFVLDFLADVARLSIANRMGPENLAMVFAPCLMRCPSDNPVAMLQLLELEKLFVCRAITLVTQSGCAEELETAIAQRPDGTSYDGRGFEEVDDDPLVVKYIEPLPQQKQPPPAAAPKESTVSTTSVVVTSATPTSAEDQPGTSENVPRTPHADHKRHHSTRRRSSSVAGSPSTPHKEPPKSGAVAPLQLGQSPLRAPALPLMPVDSLLLTPTRPSRSPHLHSHEQRDPSSPYRSHRSHHHHQGEFSSDDKKEKKPSSDKEAAEHAARISKLIRKARDEHLQLTSALQIIRDKLEQAGSVLEAEQLSLLANTFAKQVQCNVCDTLHCKPEKIEAIRSSSSFVAFAPLRPLGESTTWTESSAAGPELAKTYAAASSNLERAHVCLAFVGDSFLDQITSASRAARVRSVLRTLRKFLAQQIQEVLAMLRASQQLQLQQSPSTSSVPSRGSSPSVSARAAGAGSDFSGSFPDLGGCSGAEGLAALDEEAAEDAAASALESLRTRARQLRDMSTVLAANHNAGSLDTSAVASLVSEAEPLVRVIRELASFMRSRSIAPSSILPQPPTRSADRTTHQLAMTLHYTELMSAQLDAIEAFASSPSCPADAVLPLARLLQNCERSLSKRR